MKISFFLVFAVVFAFTLNAQDTQTLKRSGEKAFKKSQYRNAYPFFEQILKTDSTNLNALYKSGVCNLYRFSKEEALKNLLNVYQQDSTYSTYLYYWLGRAYHLNYQLEKAEFFYSKFQRKVSKNSIQYKDVERFKYQLICAADYISNPGNYQIQNVGNTINSSFSEHSPVLSSTDNMLLFTSRRINTTSVKEEYDGEPFEDIFYSTKIDSLQWTKPISFQLNTPGHDACIQLYDNDTKLFLYSYLKGGDIYTSTLVNNTWTKPQSFKEINTVDFEADVFVTADGKRLYYATNHFKKKGDLDIYYLTKNKNGNWSKPKALSSTINTDEDEESPFITADGKTMYFSSRGHTSMGGYDIFKSVWDSTADSWTKPVNLGFPINTPDDDLYFILSNTSSKAYFSSYRTGGFGEKDIYAAVSIEEVQIDGLLAYENNKSLNQSNYSITLKPLETASKNAKGKDIIVSINGAFSFTALSSNAYKVLIFEESKLIATDTLSLKLVSDKNQHLTYTYLLPEKEHVDSVLISGLPTIQDSLQNPAIVATKEIAGICYFAINSSTIGSGIKFDLREIVAYLNTHPDAMVDLAGHADASGPEKLNIALSLKRATNVKAYLLSKGISDNRIQLNSFGSSKPLATNDTQLGRSKNRRVEVKVLNAAF